jgi:hypothetical protein
MPNSVLLFLVRPKLDNSLLLSHRILVVIAFLELTSYINAGEAVDVEDEVVVVNSIVLPNKTLNVSVQEEIIL